MLISLATPCHRKRRQVLASSMNVPQKGFSNWCMYLTQSRASATQTVAKWSYRTKGIEPHACIEIENYATLFFMVNMASSMVHRCVCPMMKKTNVTQHGSHTPANTKSWFTAYIFHIGHPFYDQFIVPCQTRYLLTSFTWLYHGLKFRATYGHTFFEVDQ